MRIIIKPKGKEQFYIEFSFPSQEEHLEVADLIEAVQKDKILSISRPSSNPRDFTWQVSRTGKDEFLRDFQTILRNNPRISKFKVEIEEQEEGSGGSA
ncbi:MAG: hypothetical protein HYS60_00680 [Candidatus Wildermuthbacteria bacterium]|nr:hypothetical protein [Candidatus Wildermuthbacteria bacterium]